MSKINTFIFDLDGVITDTAEYHYLAWKQLADEESLEFDKELNEDLKGVSRTDSLQIILKHNNKKITEEELDDWAERKNSYYVELIKTVRPKDILPGIPEILSVLKERKINIGLGSASKNAVTVLNGLNILDYFDFIGDGNSVKNSKPAPDLFLHVAEILNVTPNNCVVVEDAEAGIEAAKKAGMTAVGIGTKEKMHQADFIYNSPADISIENLLKKLL
jgi:beta-phosphoglucomutase